MSLLPICVSVSALRDALKSALALVDRTGLHPIYQFARWTLEPKGLAIRATDGTIELIRRVPCVWEIDGFPARPLASTEGIETLDVLVDIRSALATLPRGSRHSFGTTTITNHAPHAIYLQRDKNMGGYAFAYSALAKSSEVEPESAEIATIEYDPAQAATLRSAIWYALLAASDDLTRPHMAAVILTRDGHGIGTDGYRLHVTEGLRSFELPAGRLGDISIPLAAARLLVELIANKAPIALRLTRSGEIETLTASTPLGDVRAHITERWVPPHEHLTSRNQPVEFSINVKALRKALDTSAGAVLFTACEKLKSVICTPGEVGTAPEPTWTPETPITIAGSVHANPRHVPDFQVFPRYLRDAVALCTGDEVIITSAGPLDPIVVHNGNQTGIVMPLRR